ncbi:unnamed protein product [Linum tenue]|uniref:Uncharacterized protein n=1 Tax=Linum tenue TaxID=586396 RepID=A0AAV0JFR6_9ROSI|nr:unnamed protein product [Linum tenue]
MDQGLDWYWFCFVDSSHRGDPAAAKQQHGSVVLGRIGIHLIWGKRRERIELPVMV